MAAWELKIDFQNGGEMNPAATGKENMAMQPLMRFKLTKKKFFALQDGVFLASNAMTEYCKPCFAGNVWGISLRHLQWQMIVDRKANNRLCDIWQSCENFHEHIEHFYFNNLLSVRIDA